MKISPEINIKPFVVPGVVSEDRKLPPAAAPSPATVSGCNIAPAAPPMQTRQFLVSELTPATLEELCEEFTQGVFEKAGKERPAYLNGIEVLVATEASGCGDECCGDGCDRGQKAPSYQDHMCQDYDELNAKRRKLSMFIGSDAFTRLSQADKNLAANQLDAMNTYASILGHRISNL